MILASEKNKKTRLLSHFLGQLLGHINKTQSSTTNNLVWHTCTSGSSQRQKAGVQNVCSTGGVVLCNVFSYIWVWAVLCVVCSMLFMLYWVCCYVVSDRHTSSVSPYRYPESRDEQKPGPERWDCEAFVTPPKGLMQWDLGHSRGRNLSAIISVYESGSWQTTVNWL